MKDAFVVDASVGVSWVYSNQASDLTGEWLAAAEAGSTIHVPALWPLEVANVLLQLVRRNRMTHTHRTRAISLFSHLRILVDTEATNRAWTSISDLAITHNLSIYDAAYLELAQRKNLPLACRDEALHAAATVAGVEVL